MLKKRTAPPKIIIKLKKPVGAPKGNKNACEFGEKRICQMNGIALYKWELDKIEKYQKDKQKPHSKKTVKSAELFRQGILNLIDNDLYK